MTGDLGDGFALLYNSLYQFSNDHFDPSTTLSGTKLSASHAACPTDLTIAEMPLLLTAPGHRQDIRRALLDLILSAKESVTLRSWYFLPDEEIMNALLSQAEKGVRVTILFSHHTRMPFIDIANRGLCRRLERAGVRVLRYNGRYMHAKEAWNDQGDILLGSANIDRWALRTNFECRLFIQNQALANQLNRELQADMAYCCPPQKQEGRWLPRPRFG